ncbi:MAG TPA: hypothetical protein VFJ02_11215 [Vicinamibacterales bacterium]|nr:hypothetical protein [Vicinamibacterales bacterium]
MVFEERRHRGWIFSGHVHSLDHTVADECRRRAGAGGVPWEIFCDGRRFFPFDSTARPKALQIIAFFACLQMARLLPSNAPSIDVSRLAVLSIVVTLAVGQNSALLCRIWCHPHASTTLACEHPDTDAAARVTGTDLCTEIAAGTTAVVREDGRAGGSSPVTQHTGFVPAQSSVSPASYARAHWDPNVHHRLEGQPLPTVLRI